MSGKTYKIIDTLQRRWKLFSDSTDCCKNGVIFGFSPSQGNVTYCIGCATSVDDIPYGNVLIGAFFLENSITEKSIADFCAELAKDKKSGKLLVYQYLNETISCYDIKTKKFSECSYELGVNYQEALDFLVQIELDYGFQLKFQYSTDDNGFKNLNLDEQLKNIQNVVFQLTKSSFQFGGQNDIPNILIEDLYNQIEEFNELMDVQIPANMRKKLIEKSQKQLKTKRSTLSFKTDGFKQSSIPKKIILESEKTYNIECPMKIFLNLQLQNNVQQLHKAFQNSLKKILLDLKFCLQEINLNDDNSWSMPQVLNFYDPTNYSHVITAVYHRLDSEEKYKLERKKIHWKYLVPMSCPTFKLANSLGKCFSLKKLTNVHVGLHSGIRSGQCSIVKKHYVYFHYNQGGFMDTGWGCAYRSLQTIISWFLLQGYIDIEQVPTHRDIQQALIDVGDKPTNFLGSSKWIGSQEVCYVLSHLYNIQSKIIFINSATELNDKARDLLKHFQTNGTPVMIGGGVLAHTIIGVDFDETTGDVRYLVLDPHYVGDEDIAQIHKKAGCAWKPVSFWDKNSFYNLCLPQVPNEF